MRKTASFALPWYLFTLLHATELVLPGVNFIKNCDWLKLLRHACCLVKGLRVDLLPASTGRPSLPVGDNLGRDITLQLLDQSLVSLGLLVAATDPGDTGKPSTDVEIVFTRLCAADETALREDGGQVILDVADDVLPVVRREGEEIPALRFTLVDLQDAAVRCELLSVEG